MKNRYEYLCGVAEEMNKMFKAEGNSDRAIVIQSNPENKRTLKIVILRYVGRN